MATANNRSVGVAAGLVAAAAFATSGPVVKPLLQAGWSPGAAILVRLSVAAVLLAGPAAWALRGKWHVLRHEWRGGVGFGGFGGAPPAALYFLPLHPLPPAVALRVEDTRPPPPVARAGGGARP